MDHDHLAPARRVVFRMENNSFTYMTDSGHKLFDVAIAWLTSSPGPTENGVPSSAGFSSTIPMSPGTSSAK
jgi:hypothetical protein